MINILFIIIDLIWILFNMGSWFFNTGNPVWDSFVGFHKLTCISCFIIIILKVIFYYYEYYKFK